MNKQQFYEKYFYPESLDRLKFTIDSIELTIRETLKDAKDLKDPVIQRFVELLKENHLANKKAYSFHARLQKALSKV
jgi:hypothetical protein